MGKSLQRLRDELSAAIVDLDGAQMQWRPRGRPDAWSIQQIVEHLLLTYAGTSETLGIRMAKGAATRRSPTLAQRLAQFTVLKAGYLPRGRAAPEPVQPGRKSAARSGEALASDVSSALGALDALIGRCEPVLGRRRAVTHFVLGPLSLAQWSKFHLVHGRLHVGQIWAVRREHGGDAVRG